MEITNNGLTLDLDITEEQLIEYNNPRRERLLHEIFPDLLPCERMFINLGQWPGPDQIDMYRGPRAEKKCYLCPIEKGKDCKYVGAASAFS